MNRRAYLSAAALALLAGCTTSDSGETTTTTPPPTTTTTTAEPTTTATTTTETETTTAEPTTEESPTAAPDRVDELLNLTVADLDATVEAFVDRTGPEKGFHALNASIRFSFDDVSEPLYEARDRITKLDRAEKTETQRTRLARLREVYWFLWWTAKTHENLNLAYYRVNNAVSRFYAAEYDRIETQTGYITEEVDAARGTFDNLVEESRASSLDAIDALDPDDYTRKVDHFEREMAQFEQFVELLLAFRDAIRRMRRGFDEYRGGNYDDASGTFYLAARRFEDVYDAVTEVDAVVALASYLDDFACLTDALARGSQVLDEAATAGGNDIPEKQGELEDEARAEFESCDLVMEYVPIVPDFFDDLPENRS